MSLKTKFTKFMKSLNAGKPPPGHGGRNQSPGRSGWNFNRKRAFTGTREPDDGDSPGSDGR